MSKQKVADILINELPLHFTELDQGLLKLESVSYESFEALSLCLQQQYFLLQQQAGELRGLVDELHHLQDENGEKSVVQFVNKAKRFLSHGVELADSVEDHSSAELKRIKHKLTSWVIEAHNLAKNADDLVEQEQQQKQVPVQLSRLVAIADSLKNAEMVIHQTIVSLQVEDIAHQLLEQSREHLGSLSCALKGMGWILTGAYPADQLDKILNDLKLGQQERENKQISDGTLDEGEIELF